ncbi:MAG: hypothetical protein EZS28_035021, partial [Streblomastix strix]
YKYWKIFFTYVLEGLLCLVHPCYRPLKWRDEGFEKMPEEAYV